ncbi:nucleotidyltransferase family protein [Aliiglaciecola sp.]|nr:nucleotidyltransferase family protein [Aliiglaciecola sp.]
MTSANEKQTKITLQTVHDLATWLSPFRFATEEQQKRILSEQGQLSIFYLANQFWLMGALMNKLQRHSVWQEFDELTIEYLVSMEAFYAERSDSIQQEAIKVCTLFQQQNIDIILLKGAATLFNRISSPTSVRFMSDIDILVPESQQAQAVKILDENGYREDEVELKIDAKGHYHAPPLKHPDSICYIEIHRAAQKTSLQELLPTQDLWDRAVPLELTQDLCVKQLCPVDQIVLSIVHSQLADGGFDEKQIELRQLYDFTTLINRHGNDVDWGKITQRFSETQDLDAYYGLLNHANRLLGYEYPIPKPYVDSSTKHYTQCMSNLLQVDGEDKRVSSVMRVLKGYSKETMMNLYGSTDFSSIMRARFKHFVRHVKKSMRLK